ncbi:MAG: ketoacyl-ACP synthase III [Candidatus Marinimicrobia bacterium]|jgi:3-oxoacyl-[acyl-carrier-protein] synthase-3|nr:ketoacyl-ACP synthase III [Candidatus Neomarinimicrobiota bacterium]MBT3501302.1 ketoacyl-ACP synthase III [Candidatus Neomarinimicrobiota bacterium]MBT3838502.1 ketoacyl-ACP synthase III [Candidatus Neomarinimicrobiota bacterium]MBT3999884.1 ketoacyl-ACP synthase III [Candidatus Neomarinimicrobiota bacterium]MBT4282864.1 ketoacyl-ACP synthase III [Candidatus Neomarinimicrobiota bacterium]
MNKSAIIGVGFHVPENVVTNQDLTTMMDTSPDWIKTRSGIEERRWVQGDEAASDLAIPAARKAIEMAGVSPEEIDIVIVATLSADYFFPGISSQLQDQLGLRNVPAFDIRAACSAFVYAISIADQFIKTGMYKTALVVGAEAQSKFVNKTTEGRDIAVLFGDGAGAAILQASESENGILSTHLHCQGKDLKNLWMEGPGSSGDNQINKLTIEQGKIFEPYMNGREVFKNAVVRFPEVIQEALDENNLTLDDVSLIIPHQANLRIIQSVAKRMGVEQDKFYANIQRYGNTTAASIPIALCEAVEEGKVKKGDTIILAAFGAGYTWASAAIRW